MRKMLLTAVLVGLMAVPLFAQRPGGGGERPVTVFVLLSNKGVQEELKLTDKQKEAAGEVSKNYMAAVTKAGFRDKDAREKAGEEATKAAAKIVDELKAEQKKRLNQIEVQVLGIRAFTKEEVASALKLSDKQKDEIKEVAEETGKDVRELMKDVGRDKDKRTEAMTKVAKLRKEAINKITKSFSDEQKKTYKDLTGEPFEYKPEFGGGGRRPGKGAEKKDI
jgi:hypothetical protein